MKRTVTLFLMSVLLFCACHTRQTLQPAAAPAGETAGGKHPSAAGRKARQADPSADPHRDRRYAAFFLEAVRQKQQEHTDAQYELLNAALKLKPDASEALYEMALLKLSYTTYSDTLSKAEGYAMLHRAVALEPENLSYKESLGTYFANAARYREAIRIYEEVAEAKLTEETLATLIWLYKASGDFAGAIRTIDRLEIIDGRSEELSIEKFQTYLAMNDTEHAYQAIEELCAEYPLDLRYRVLLGDLYDQNGYHERALSIYRDVLAAEPENSFAQISLLAYYKSAGADSLYHNFLRRVVLNPQTQGAARQEVLRTYALDNVRREAEAQPVCDLFGEAFAHYPDDAGLAELYADYVAEKKLPADSLLTAVERILRIAPDNTKARLSMLQIMLQRNDMEAVARVCREGELYVPSEVTYYYYEGIALFRLGQNNEVIRVLQRGAERIDERTDAQLASDMLALLGDVLYDSRLNEEAFIAYDSALVYNPMNLLCLNNYAYYLSLTGEQLDKAAAMSKITVEAEAANPTYLDTYAWILYRQGQYEMARIYINETLNYAEETPENASLFDHAGDIYYRCGQRASAIDYWKKALKLATDKTLRSRIQRKVRRRRP